MATKVYKFYSDPGHGWIAVKRKELEVLGIVGEISHYSYQRGATVYLEEDCDYARFAVAREKAGNPLSKDQIVDIHTNNRSPIRSYDSFKA